MLLHSFIDPKSGFFLDPGYMTPQSLRVRYTNIHHSHLMCVVIELNMCFLSVSSHGSYCNC